METRCGSHQISRAPTADAAEGNEQNACCGLGKPSAPAALAFGDEPGEPQARWERLGGALVVGRAQRPPLLGVLRYPFTDLGVSCEIGANRLGAVGRQSAVDKGHQLVVAYRAGEIGHFTFPSGALSCCGSPLR